MRPGRRIRPAAVQAAHAQAQVQAVRDVEQLQLSDIDQAISFEIRAATTRRFHHLRGPLHFDAERITALRRLEPTAAFAALQAFLRRLDDPSAAPVENVSALFRKIITMYSLQPSVRQKLESMEGRSYPALQHPLPVTSMCAEALSALAEDDALQVLQQFEQRVNDVPSGVISEGGAYLFTIAQQRRGRDPKREEGVAGLLEFLVCFFFHSAVRTLPPALQRAVLAMQAALRFSNNAPVYFDEDAIETLKGAGLADAALMLEVLAGALERRTLTGPRAVAQYLAILRDRAAQTRRLEGEVRGRLMRLELACRTDGFVRLSAQVLQELSGLERGTALEALELFVEGVSRVGMRAIQSHSGYLTGIIRRCARAGGQPPPAPLPAPVPQPPRSGGSVTSPARPASDEDLASALGAALAAGASAAADAAAAAADAAGRAWEWEQLNAPAPPAGAGQRRGGPLAALARRPEVLLLQQRMEELRSLAAAAAAAQANGGGGGGSQSPGPAGGGQGGAQGGGLSAGPDEAILRIRVEQLQREKAALAQQAEGWRRQCSELQGRLARAEAQVAFLSALARAPSPALGHHHWSSGAAGENAPPPMPRKGSLGAAGLEELGSVSWDRDGPLPPLHLHALYGASSGARTPPAGLSASPSTRSSRSNSLSGAYPGPSPGTSLSSASSSPPASSSAAHAAAHAAAQAAAHAAAAAHVAAAAQRGGHGGGGGGAPRSGPLAQLEADLAALQMNQAQQEAFLSGLLASPSSFGKH
eukprot:tig00021127_g18761.t1